MPSNAKLLEIIHLQTEIAKLGIDLSQVMALVVERTVPLVRADGAAIELAEGEDMVYRAVSGNAKAFLGLRIKRKGSLSGLCVQAGEVLLCEDSETDPRVDRQATRKIGLRSMIVMPLRYRDATVGVLKVMSAEANKFQKEDEMILGLLSEVVAAAMFHATRLESDDLLHKATHDALTDLANRSLFMDRLRNILSSNSNQAGLLIIDMDGLKAINDSLGHRAGDAAIKELASRISMSTKESDLVARLGGDEFAVILTPLQGSDGISETIRRIELSFEREFTFEGQTIPIHASMGGASFPDDSMDLEKLIETADSRMYAAKRSHRQNAASTPLNLPSKRNNPE